MTDEAKDFLIDKGTSLEYGARPLRRAIEHYLEDPLAEDLLRGTFQGKDTITVRVSEVDGEKKLGFDAVGKEPPPAPPTPNSSRRARPKSRSKPKSKFTKPPVD